MFILGSDSGPPAEEVFKPKLLSSKELERYRTTWKGRDLFQDEVKTLFCHIDALERFKFYVFLLLGAMVLSAGLGLFNGYVLSYFR